MKFLKIFLLTLFFFGLALSKEEEKHPWEIQIQGNSFFSTYQLEEELIMPEEFGNMDTTKQNFIMRLSEEELVGVYYASGFFSMSVQTEITRDSSDEDSPVKRIFTFHINEGERYRFNDLKTIVDSPEDELPIDTAKLNSNRNGLYDQAKISAKLQDISNIYQGEGYLHSTISYIERIDTLSHFVNVDIYISPGKQVRMGGITSQTARSGDRNSPGLTDTAWLSGLWRIPKGEVLNGKQSAAFKSKLFSTQLFTQVKMQDSLREDGLSNIQLYVQERVPGEMRYGIFYEQLYGFGASASAKHKNFFGRFHEFGAGALVAQHKQEASLVYAHPLLFGTSIQFIPTAIRFENTLSFNHEKISPPAYPDSTEERYEIINRANLTFGFSQNIRFRGTFDTRFVDKNGDKLFKMKLESALTFDYTDDFFNPQKGIRIMPTVGIGTNFQRHAGDFEMIGNPYTYGELTTSLYFPIFRPLFGALSGSCGKFFNKTIEDDARVFYQGGSRTVRGYRFRSIYASYNSTDEDGEEIINTALTPIYLRLNAELRLNIPMKVLRNWQVVQFFDWTHAMDRDDSLYEDSERAAWGLGLRYRWQFLTFRLDYTFKKYFDDFSPEAFELGRISFDLSQAF